MRYLAAIISILAFVHPFGLAAQISKPTTLAELAVYNGPDREQLLVAGAKKEGKVVWYTALAGGSYSDLRTRFRNKICRAGGILSRHEPRPDRQSSGRDPGEKIFNGCCRKLAAITHAHASDEAPSPFSVPHLAKFSADAKEDAGKGTVFWATDRESYMGFAYNKDKLPATAVPKNYDGLLNPALKGKMAFVTTDTGSRTVGAMLRAKGEEFLKRLRTQELTMHSVSAQALNDMIISGEVEASPTIFRNHALVAAAKGAPVAWLPMEIVPASAGSAGLSSQAPHPHAAVLFIDFLFSPDGQKNFGKLRLRQRRERIWL